MKKVFAFDFDGTLTTRDTLIDFIRFARGNVGFLVGFLLYSPLLVLMKLHLYSNDKSKQKVFSYFFRGMQLDEFNGLCRRYAHERRHILRASTLQILREALQEGADVYVVSASVDSWVAPFLAEENLEVTVLGTQIEVKDGRLTGLFSSRNCYGAEKVERLKAVLPAREGFHLTAYGDSRGDRELLAWADEGHLV
uniref:HAD-IB family hydrolase n=1 Tax=Prevotella sp. GTC17260 TaxID=3236796 RepID=A0AB33JB71_9BACT